MIKLPHPFVYNGMQLSCMALACSRPTVARSYL